METLFLIVLGIFVGVIVVSQAFARPPRDTIVIVPVEPTELSPVGLGCLPFFAVGVLILLFLSVSR